MNYQVKKITHNVLGFISQRKIKSNVYLIMSPDEFILIDTGWSGTYKEIFKLMSSLDLNVNLIKKILLTHGDGDHVGNVRYIANQLGAKVYAGEETAKLLAIPKSPKHYRFPVNLFVKLGFFVQIKSYIVDFIIKEESLFFDSIELQVFNTPGHCNGHLSFYLPNQKILFAGDVLNNFGELTVSDKKINLDNLAILISARMLLNKKPSLICPGHGDIWTIDKNSDEIDKLIKWIDMRI